MRILRAPVRSVDHVDVPLSPFAEANQRRYGVVAAAAVHAGLAADASPRP